MRKSVEESAICCGRVQSGAILREIWHNLSNLYLRSLHQSITTYETHNTTLFPPKNSSSDTQQSSGRADSWLLPSFLDKKCTIFWAF
jgi:hypothetical protein